MRGARQVGKSTLVRQCAQAAKRECIELNFERTPGLADFFISLQPETILKQLATYFQKKMDPDAILLFLDEVQATPKVLESLRYFYEELPQLPVIAAGSLLDFVLKASEFSMPVGRVEYHHLGPLSFEDFLVAMGETALLEWIQTVQMGDAIPPLLHQKCLNLIKQFWLIGGMPEIVAHYSTHRDFQAIDHLKHNLLQTYEEDFYKYGRVKQIPILRRVFHALPGLVGKTLKYAHIDRESKAIQVRGALEALHLAKMVHLIYHSAATGLPLDAHADLKIFKNIFLDIGLQCTALGLNTLHMIQVPEVLWTNRGDLAEQFVGQMLLKLFPSYQMPQLFYWLREHAQAAAEIDYVWQWGTQIIPIEVKAGKTGRLKSLQYFIVEKQWPLAVRFNMDVPSIFHEVTHLPERPKTPYTLISLPFYLVGQLPRFLV
jgi:hypothetical protein